MYALDKDNGKIKWSYDVKKDGQPTSFHGNSLIADELIIIGTDSTVGHVFAFEQATGKVRWKYETKLGVPTDIVRSGSNLYAITMSDELLCLDLKTGKLKWKFPSGVLNSMLLVRAPKIIDNKVFFGTQTGYVYALDAESGKVIWKRLLGSQISSSFAVSGEDLYVGTFDGHIYRLNWKTGSLVNKFNFGGYVEGNLIVADNSLLVLNSATGRPISKLSSIDLQLKRIKWEHKGRWATPRPLISDGLIYLGKVNGEVNAFRLSDGTAVWSHKFKGVVRSVNISKDVLYVGVQNGTVYAYRK